MIQPPTDALAAKFGLLGTVGIIGWDWVQIEKTGLARVSFFGDLDLDAKLTPEAISFTICVT